jgi:hypothetical protein
MIDADKLQLQMLVCIIVDIVLLIHDVCIVVDAGSFLVRRSAE